MPNKVSLTLTVAVFRGMARLPAFVVANVLDTGPGSLFRPPACLPVGLLHWVKRGYIFPKLRSYRLAKEGLSVLGEPPMTRHENDRTSLMIRRLYDVRGALGQRRLSTATGRTQNDLSL